MAGRTRDGEAGAAGSAGPHTGVFDGRPLRAGPTGLVAIGADLEPATLISAYRHGVFPWPSEPGVGSTARQWQLTMLARARRLDLLPASDGSASVFGARLPWFCPDPRCVVAVDKLHVSRSVARRVRRSDWTVSLDADFAGVVAGCADRAEPTWITGEIAAAYRRLHALGVAHSIEVWQGADLIGGVYGVAVGGVFVGESMFHRVTDASKVALWALARRFAAAGGRVLDAQMPTEHLLSLGFGCLARPDYLALLAALRDEPLTWPAGRQAAADLPADD